jgi:hypothetical protein
MASADYDRIEQLVVAHHQSQRMDIPIMNAVQHLHRQEYELSEMNQKPYETIQYTHTRMTRSNELKLNPQTSPTGATIFHK